MLRGIPPHLWALFVLLVMVVWVMLVHRIRQSSALHRFVAETFGDDTPESALAAFEAARQRLADHLNADRIEPALRRRIEVALGETPVEEPVSKRDSEFNA